MNAVITPSSLSSPMSSNDNDNDNDIDETTTLIPSSLYALLSYRGELGAWEWSFFLPDSAGKAGTLFYVKITTAALASSHSNSHSDSESESESRPYWKFEMDTRPDILSSPEAVALVRLADLADLGQYEEVAGENGICPMFRAVSIPEPDSLHSPSSRRRRMTTTTTTTRSSSSGHNSRTSLDGDQSMTMTMTTMTTTSMVPVEFSSRTWFLDAVGSLHDCGVVQCEDVWLLEREIRRFAFSAMNRYLQNQGCTVFTSEKCS